jgi:signal transduction histidine kinase
VEDDARARRAFEAEVAGRFGMLPNFFRSAQAAPELIRELWGFAKAGYLDNPMPAVFKERLFVWLSRFCPMRYCIVRHVGFLLGHGYGHAAGDASAVPQTIEQVVGLLKRPTPWQRDMTSIYARLGEPAAVLEAWPDEGTDLEDAIFACAAVMFTEPARSEEARRALLHVLGSRRYEFFAGCLAFIRTAHYWTVLHPEIGTEEDMAQLLREHEELARLLLEDPESDRCEMGQRLFGELTSLRELNERRELERAKQTLLEKDRQKDEFIAVLAHELRNPLGTIRAASDALSLMQIEDPRIAKLTERLDRQTVAMSRMLDDLLDASRIALGKVSIQLEPVAILELLADILNERRPIAEKAGLDLVTSSASPSCIVRADRVRLGQIIDNLLSNAIKFTPAGGTIHLSLAEEEGYAVLKVRDSGIGFEEQFAPKLFEPFMQREQGQDRAEGGLGLGLAISSRLAALQGATLSAVSEGIGTGALFTLAIPLAARSGDSRPIAAPVSSRSQGSILVVEDNKDAAESLQYLLDLMGFEVMLASDGPSAIRAAVAAPPDFILCDLGLPGEMDGYAVARACHAEASLRSTRLVGFSGYSSPEHHAEATAAGFERLLTKPVTRETLALLADTSNV